MLQKLRTRLTGLTLFAAFVGAFLAPAAQATPITFYNDAGTQTTQRFTVGCNSVNGSCAGLLVALSDDSPLAWSSTVGQMLAGSSNASPAAETIFVNSLLGTALTHNSAGNVSPSTSGKTIRFQLLDAGYFLIKVGGGPTHQAYALLHNLGGNLDVWFKATGQAGGLSHYLVFNGETVSVPEPATLGLFGLGALLLAGFLGLRRRYD